MVVMKVLEAGCCDDEGYTGKVAISVSLLSHRLRLFFYHPLRDILDLLGSMPTQLHPFAMRAYLCACIMFCMTLKSLGDPYLDLTA